MRSGNPNVTECPPNIAGEETKNAKGEGGTSSKKRRSSKGERSAKSSDGMTQRCAQRKRMRHEGMTDLDTDKTAAAKTSDCKNEEDPRVPVLVITDIGRDIDDTLALLALFGLEAQQHLRIVGAIATGGRGDLRARVTRFWLRRAGYDDKEVPIAACLSEGRPGCYVPEGTPSSAKEACISTESASSLILRLAKAHKGALVIFAIAPLSPLADALLHSCGHGEEDAGSTTTTLEDSTTTLRKGISTLCIQGQAHQEAATTASSYGSTSECGGGGERDNDAAARPPSGLVQERSHFLPDFAAFNLREDKKAAETVFSRLQGHVRFHLLGKHAAYRVHLDRKDFRRWDELLAENSSSQSSSSSSSSSPSLLSVRNGEMTRTARGNLGIFREGNPELFAKLYPAPPPPPGSDGDGGGDRQRRREQHVDWFAGIETLSHPYDALLVLSFFKRQLFDWVEGAVGRDGDDGASSVVLIGNTEASHGVSDASRVHDEMCAMIADGVRRVAAASRSQAVGAKN